MQLTDHPRWIDDDHVRTTMAAALGNGVILHGRDGPGGPPFTLPRPDKSCA